MKHLLSTGVQKNFPDDGKTDEVHIISDPSMVTC